MRYVILALIGFVFALVAILAVATGGSPLPFAVIGFTCTVTSMLNAHKV